MNLFRQVIGVGRKILLSRSYGIQPLPQQEVKKLLIKDKIVVFINGAPENPLCGSSNAIVQLLQAHGVPFNSYDIHANEKLREAVKDYSQWNEVPQVFINGQFIGDSKTITEMHFSGNLIEEFEKIGFKSNIGRYKNKN